MADIQYMSIKEFRQLGFLQEANRQFFHPLGLALQVVIDTETGEEKLCGIWDYRDDPEGIRYGDTIDEQKAAYVAKLQAGKAAARQKRLGYVVQPFHEEGNDAAP